MSDAATVLLLERVLSELQGLRGDLAAARTAAAPAPPSEPGGLWDAQQVATYLNCSKSWVYDAEGAGRLPSLHIGGMLRFDPQSIREVAHGKPAGGKLLRLKT